jgi:adenosylmethionine-8-amino-7-oxononanoate aminotransferase
MDPSLEQLRQWDREIVWHGFTQMAEYEPWIIERAEGCWLIDADGQRYVDGVSSLWCNVHGHRRPEIDAAIRSQLEQVAHVTSLGMSHPTTIQLARQLVDLVPSGLRHVFFSDDGSTALEVALKMALQYWQQCPQPKPAKQRYVALQWAYHGDTLGSTSVGGIPRFHEVFHPLLFDALRAPAPDQYRRPAGVTRQNAAEYYLQQLQQVLEQHHESVAAVVVEPIMQGAAGMLAHPPGYLRGVRELTRRYEVLLIADEVAVGFGRTGTMFACEQEGVTPDLLCLAKGLTGGYLPMAATLTTTEIWDAFLGDYAQSRTFFHGHTYGGNPLAAAAALASLKIFEQDQTLRHVAARAAQLEQELKTIAAHPHVGDVRQRGLMVGVELVRDRDGKEPFRWEEQRGVRACQSARQCGVALRPLGNVIVIMPPLSISSSELNLIVQAVRFGIDRATDSNWFSDKHGRF